MLDLTEEGLDIVLQGAAERRDDALGLYEALVQRYHTSAYDGATRHDTDDWLENHPQQYVQLVKTRMVYSRPRVKVWSELSFLRQLALAIRHQLDWSLENTTTLKEMQDVATDVLFNWGWMLTVLDDIPGSKTGRMMPRSMRLDQRDVIADDHVDRPEECRFISHEYLQDKDWLLAEADENPDSWYTRRLEALPIDQDEQDDRHHDSSADMRNMVRLRDIWVGEYQTKDSPGPEYGFNGTWFTMAVIGGGGRQRRHLDFIRPPRPAFCHPEGPYTLFGASRVPTKFYPLAPLVAQHHQAAEANRHVQAISNAMDTFRNVILYDQRDRQTAQRLKNSVDQQFVGIPNLQRTGVVPAQIGGPADQQMEWVGMLLQRLERASGLTTWMQGLMSGDPTATEANIAFTSGSMRFAELEINFEQAAAKVLEKMGHLAYYSSEVRMPLDDEAAQELGMESPAFFVGGNAGGIDPQRVPYSALRLSIEPTSMRKVDESTSAAKMLQTIDLASGMLPVIAQYPSFPWHELMGMAADKLNTPELAELFTPEIVAAVVEDAQAQMEMQAELGASGAPQRSSAGGGGSPTANMGSGPRTITLGGQGGGEANLLGRPSPNTSTDRAQKARNERSGSVQAGSAA